MELDWHSIEDIGILLQEKFPETDPLTVRFTDLHKMVIDLSGFKADPKASNEAILEAVQMAWYEEYQDAQE
ncbi:Fe-S cluster assembly protein IscX [Nitrospira defluvii]|nr:Fe-S cluster assembly protein IscX [Nitrospira defluvii]